MARKNMAGLAGRDHEAGLLRVRKIVEATKTAAYGAGERHVGRRVGTAAAVERVEAAARRNAEVAQPVQERDMGIDLVLEQRFVLRAPAPLGHIGAVALDQQGQSIIERPPERFAAVR